MELEKISDIDVYLFIGKGLKGGIPCIAKRYAKASKKYVKNYNSTKPSKFISYFDMNNLYGWGMSQYIPHGGFKWLKNVDNFDVNSISEKSSTGCILDVDLEYPNELRYLHNDYPLAPEKLAILYDILSDYCKNIADKYKKRLVMLKN